MTRIRQFSCANTVRWVSAIDQETSLSSATLPISARRASPAIDQGDGLIPAAAATNLRAENDLRRADVPGRPSYRDRSPIFAVSLKIVHQIAQRHHWLARRWVTANEQRDASQSSRTASASRAGNARGQSLVVGAMARLGDAEHSEAPSLTADDRANPTARGVCIAAVISSQLSSGFGLSSVAELVGVLGNRP